MNSAYVRKINDEAGDFSSKFYYDRLGRIVVSQNSRQRTESKYSYTLYDALGRVTEAGEKTENGNGPKFKTVFGTFVNQQLIPTVIDDTKLSDWLTDSVGERREVTKSYYDQTLLAGLPSALNTATQRKRIVHVTYEEVYDGNDQTFDHATHYDYDIHGNVKTLYQENRKMVVEDNQLGDQYIKRMDYTYDLVSGNVHRVSYQTGKVDQMHHVYQYDADNRITQVHTTETTPLANPSFGLASLRSEPSFSPHWHKDATYVYYKHGPLSRVVLGSQNVQGIDYYYTLQGWLKGVNATDLSATRSSAGDGNSTRAAKDVFSYSLHYFRGDYIPINSDFYGGNYMDPFAQIDDSWAINYSHHLYNGNIARMVTTITDPTNRDVLVLGNAYKYDQLNRLVQSTSNKEAFDLSNYRWDYTDVPIYQNAFAYDANGNILHQYRADRGNIPIDDMRYNYETNRNRLLAVRDNVAYTDFDDDVDESFYTYDEEGRLKTDSQEGIDEIVWRVDGKVKAIIRDGVNPDQKNLIFDYDAMGHRIAKHVYRSDFKLEKSTYYVLDASGNVMATYDKILDNENSRVYFKLEERHIYGSSRVGVRNSDINLFDFNNQNFSMKSVHYSIGSRTYELSNHLGNVLSVISDKVIPMFDARGISEMRADIRVAQDYSPFGVTLDGRNFVVDEKYRYGWNTQEKVDEIAGAGNHYTAEFWEYSPRVVQRWNTDPVKRAHKSPYVINSNNPITNNDPNGDCDDCPKPEFNAGVKLNMTFGKNGGANVSLFAGTSLRTGFATTGLNFSGTLYGGGVGTSTSSPTLFTGVLSPSLTLGWGDGTSRPLNTFNSFSGTGVNTSYTNSVSFGQNFTFSSGSTSVAGYNRNQRTSYFGLTALNSFSAGSYNDVQRLPFWGDGGDEFWSAGLSASLTFNGFTASYTNDMYYGKSNNNATYADDEIINGINYDRQPAFDRSLNNALETFNFTMPGSMFGGTQVTLGMGRTGRSAMWPSNRMHNTIKDPEDPSKHFHHLFVPNNTSTVFRFGLQR